ncbi:sucrase/ferredoxin-like family protein [Wolffia australiana]
MEDPNVVANPISADGASAVVDGGLISGDGGIGGSIGSDAEFGFQRSEFGQEELAGTVQKYDKHLFLCYKHPEVWPSHVEAAEFDRLPRLLSAALSGRKSDIKKKTRLTLCEGEDGTESSNGDVLIFPDMIRYRRLTHFDVDGFVEEVLVKENEWLPGVVEPLRGSYVFVCSHGSRDKRCGVCGPELIKRFREEIKERGLQVSVSGCSHIGGHKYAGNVIIFSKGDDGAVTGHWYGYVSPDDVTILLDQHIGRGKVVSRLWRGQMGLLAEEQKNAQEQRLRPKDQLSAAAEINGTTTGINGGGGCCQGSAATCCQSELPASSPVAETASKTTGKGTAAKPARKVCAMPTWLERWEREDTYAALTVITAAVAVAAAYGYYKHTR